ncbi:MAG: hypothetical protein Q8Q09_26830 [Deltaproteobacteria bacterium]|nr:hypothetical protein [Deltaproteobacteria bacterium]
MLTLVLTLVPATAHAQDADDDGVGEPNVRDRANNSAPLVESEEVQVDDVLHPREGRTRVNLQGPVGLALGIEPSDLPRTRAESGARFGAEREAILCRAPCTMYLPPGVHRLQGNADQSFVWNSDFTLQNTPLRVDIRGHRVGLSALGGAMFVAGSAAAVLGPAVIVVNVWVGRSEERVTAIVAGSVAAVVGAGLLAGAWFTVMAGQPALTVREEPASPSHARHSPRAAQWALLPVAHPSGAGLSAVGTF